MNRSLFPLRSVIRFSKKIPVNQLIIKKA
jgi:hypothetical protein